VSVLNLDEGLPRYFDKPAMLAEGLAGLSVTPSPAASWPQILGAAALAHANHPAWFPHVPWSELVLRDLSESADIKIELIGSRAEAERLVRDSKRAAVLIMGPLFSKRVQRCSFLAAGWRDTLTAASAFPRPGDPVLVTVNAFFHENQNVLPLYF